MNPEELHRLQAAVADCDRRVAEAKEMVDSITQEEISLNRSREGLIQKRHACGKISQDRRTVVSRLEQKRKQLANLEKEAVDLVEEERKVKATCGVIFFSFLLLEFFVYSVSFY